MNTLLNSVAGGLVVVQLLTIGSTLLDRRKSRVATPLEQKISESSSRNLDIFFIALDVDGREDVHEEFYPHDNRSFLEMLEGLGFRVSADSRAPIFNFDYLESFARLSPDSDDRVELAESIWDGVAIQNLKRQGYSTVSFTSGYYLTEFINSDRHPTPGKSMGDFSRLLFHTTALRLFEDSNVQASQFRSRIAYTLRSLGKLGTTETPTFVMANVVAPHPPFVLDRELVAIPEGEPIHFNDGLPDPMTPVNAFRLILSRYLETDHSLFPSRSFSSAWDRPFDLMEIDDEELEMRTAQDG